MLCYFLVPFSVGMKQRSELARPPKRASEAELTSTAPNPAVGASRLGAFAANAERAELRRAHSARRSTPAPAALARQQARSKPAGGSKPHELKCRWRQPWLCVRGFYEVATPLRAGAQKRPRPTDFRTPRVRRMASDRPIWRPSRTVSSTPRKSDDAADPRNKFLSKIGSKSALSDDFCAICRVVRG